MANGMPLAEPGSLTTRQGAWGDSLRMVVAPTHTFRRIKGRPVWLPPFLLAVLVRLLHLFTFYSPSLSPAKLTLSVMLEVLPFLIPVLICSGVFFLGLLLIGAKPCFSRVFSVLTHTFFLYTLLTVGLGTIVLLVAPHPELLDRTDLVAANLGPLIDGQEHLALHHLVRSIDLVSLYQLYLIALGLSITSEGVSLRAGLWLVGNTWALYVAGGVAIKVAVS